MKRGVLGVNVCTSFLSNFGHGYFCYSLYIVSDKFAFILTQKVYRNENCESVQYSIVIPTLM